MAARTIDALRAWDLDSPLESLKGVGPARSRALAEGGFRTVRDLLFHLPLRYEDRRHLERVADVDDQRECVLEGSISGLRLTGNPWRRNRMVRGVLDDGSGTLGLLWFNRPYLVGQLDPQATYRVFGRVRVGKSGLQMINPSYEEVGTEPSEGQIVPVYPTIAGVGPALVRRLLDAVLGEIDPASELVDDLPPDLRRRLDLAALGEAIGFLHRPPADCSPEALQRRDTAAHRRLIYGEFLDLQLELGLLRRRQVERHKGHAYVDPAKMQTVAGEIVPFRLTAAQQRVVGEIVDDLRGREPMLRLLQGDVGSGKTIVAAMAMILALESGLQVAFMAPTELLAEQHLRSLRGLLGERYAIGLLSSSAADASRTAAQLASGDLDLVVGTHALIQQGVEFSRLGLAVVDEQHRFGVTQRQALQDKGDRPDMLVMTATPIPRSLALTAYGDLEFSVIDELPPGRQPVRTRVEPARRGTEAYRWLAKQIAEGAQGYVVAPRIDRGAERRGASIEEVAERVRRALGGSVTMAVLHGRLASDEREEIMASFAGGEVQVLVATTVVEVGVDVANASAMLIESAERFGLSQLHQLRGRVGRGERASTCIALHGRLTEEARRRLEVFGGSQDGFEIAEADMEIRGPGELLGTRQAGLPGFRVARLVADREWLLKARADAREILAESAGDIDYRPLLARIERRSRRRPERLEGG